MLNRYVILAAIATAMVATSAYLESAEEPEYPATCQECATDHECEALCPAREP